MQGRRHNFKSGVQILLRAKPAEKFGGCTPTYNILGVQQLQRDIRRAYRTEFCRNMLATIFLTGHAFIDLEINIPNNLQDSTNSRQKECCTAQKAKYYTLYQGLYMSDGDISVISTLISLISVSNQSSNDNVKTLHSNNCEACDQLSDGKVSDLTSDSIIPSSFINIIVIIIIIIIS